MVGNRTKAGISFAWLGSDIREQLYNSVSGLASVVVGTFAKIIKPYLMLPTLVAPTATIAKYP